MLDLNFLAVKLLITNGALYSGAIYGNIDWAELICKRQHKNQILPLVALITEHVFGNLVASYLPQSMELLVIEEFLLQYGKRGLTWNSFFCSCCLIICRFVFFLDWSLGGFCPIPLTYTTTHILRCKWVCYDHSKSAYDTNRAVQLGDCLLN